MQLKRRQYSAPGFRNKHTAKPGCYYDASRMSEDHLNIRLRFECASLEHTKKRRLANIVNGSIRSLTS